MEEPFGGQDGDGALGDFLGGDDPGGAAEVVDVAVGVDDAGNRAVAAVLAVEGEGGGCGLGRYQRVDDDDPPLALDHVHVREVESAQLVEAGRHFEEAGDPVEPALAPEAGVGGVGALLVEEGVGVEIPDEPAAGALDPGRLEAGEEAAFGVGEVLGALGRQRTPGFAVAARGDLGSRLAGGGHAASASSRRRGATA
jgi:hypothetical protein